MANDRAPLWKQLLGAVIGGSLALVIYSGYKFVGPKITAWMYTPQSLIDTKSDDALRVAETDLPDAELERMEHRQAGIAQRYAKPGTKAAAGQTPKTMEPEKDPWGATVKEWEKLEADLLAEPEPEPAPMPPPPEPVMELPEDSMPIDSSDALPDSGIGTWIAALVALFGASGLLYRRKIALAK